MDVPGKRRGLMRPAATLLASCEPQRRSALSLIEVAALVVIAVVLTAGLVPSLASVRMSGKESRCLSNLMQIGFANSMYAAKEPSDPALPVHAKQFDQCLSPLVGGFCQDPMFVGAYEWGGKSGVGVPGFVEFPGQLGSRYGTLAGFGPVTRPLNDVVYKQEFVDAWDSPEGFDRLQAQLDMGLDLPVNQCPADTGYTGIHFPAFRDSKLSSYDHLGTSYTANVFMTGAQGFEDYSNSPYLHSLSEIMSPRRTLAYYENNGRFAWSAQPMPPDCRWIGSGIAGTVRGWHGVPWVFNAAFIDGHADSIYMRSFDNSAVGPESSFWCISVRGESWNKDTLPLDRVRTNLKSPGYGRPSWEGGIE